MRSGTSNNIEGRVDLEMRCGEICSVPHSCPACSAMHTTSNISFNSANLRWPDACRRLLSSQPSSVPACLEIGFNMKEGDFLDNENSNPESRYGHLEQIHLVVNNITDIG